jgi:hypothetical protein
MGEIAQRLLKPRFSDVTPRANDIAPDIHAHT